MVIGRMQIASVEMMMKQIISVIGVTALVCPPLVLAGNAEMMQKNAASLIKLNEQAIQELDSVVKDGTVTLQARVKQHPDGHKEIYLDHVEMTPSETPVKESDQVLTSSTDYKTFIHTGTLPEAEQFSASGLTGGGVALRTTTEWTDFEATVKGQPEKKVIELKGSGIEYFSREMNIKPERGFFVYW